MDENRKYMLRCDRLTKSFDGISALANVDLRFPAQGIAAVVGPNGAGKTTLINVVSGFVRPETGRWFLRDQELTGLSPHRIAHMGVARTFQDVRLIHGVSIIENVLLAFRNHPGERLLGTIFPFAVNRYEKRIRDVAMGILQFLGLGGNASDLAGEVSYGQQKLVTLGCCLATDAEFLVLDEPVSGVHPQLAASIANAIRDLRDRGKTIVFTEHDMAFVRGLAELVVVMDQGRVIAQGPPSVVLERPEIMEAYVG